MMYGYGYGPDYGIFHAFSWVIWIILIVFLVKALKHSRDWKGPWWSQDRALDILKERYAKGEINKEEFETKKKDLLH